VQPAGGLDTVAVNDLSVRAVPTKCLTFKSKLAIVAEDDNVAAAQAAT
jgi:hypothetical protein